MFCRQVATQTRETDQAVEAQQAVFVEKEGSRSHVNILPNAIHNYLRSRHALNASLCWRRTEVSADTISCIDLDLDVEGATSLEVGSPSSLAMPSFGSYGSFGLRC